ncbi:MAG TPA: hypothetical protein V6C86_00325 [Oculatellaceae cyanobacterium]
MMDIRAIPIPELVFNLILYGCLPLWLIMGLLDYMCHKWSKIEATSGLKESLYHAVMGVQIGIPIFLGLYFQINVLILLIMFAALGFHVWVAHCDVDYARGSREISLLEVHVHSFLETLPFFTVALIVCINWNAFVDLITLNWAGHMQLVFHRAAGVSTNYIASYVALLLFADVLPYAEEFFRCLRSRKADHPSGTNGASSQVLEGDSK